MFFHKHRSKWLVLFLVVLLQTPVAMAAEEMAGQVLGRGIEELQEAYDVWQAEPFQAVMATFDQVVKKNPDDYLSHYWQGVGYYYLASFYLHARDKDKNDALGKQAVAKGIKSLELAIQKNVEDSESYALLGVMQGMMIKMNPWSAFANGPQVEKNRKKALAINPSNPRVHYLTGISLYMTPELFGGSSEKALDHMLEAITLFQKESEQEKTPLIPTWGYHTCLAFVGDIYYKKNEIEKAKKYYQKALLINPKDLKAIEGIELIEQSKQ